MALVMQTEGGSAPQTQTPKTNSQNTTTQTQEDQAAAQTAQAQIEAYKRYLQGEITAINEIIKTKNEKINKLKIMQSEISTAKGYLSSASAEVSTAISTLSTAYTGKGAKIGQDGMEDLSGEISLACNSLDSIISSTGKAIEILEGEVEFAITVRTKLKSQLDNL